VRRRGRSQRGAQALEASLIATMLFGMTFLLLDFCFSIFIRSTFQHAVREGVRYAVTGANSPGPGQDDSIKKQVQRFSFSFLKGTNINKIHVHFINPVDGTQADNAAGNIVEVSVEDYMWKPIAPFQHSGTPIAIEAVAFDVMEPIQGTLPPITTLE
jgi:hypothetical protein